MFTAATSLPNVTSISRLSIATPCYSRTSTKEGRRLEGRDRDDQGGIMLARTSTCQNCERNADGRSVQSVRGFNLTSEIIFEFECQRDDFSHAIWRRRRERHSRSSRRRTRNRRFAVNQPNLSPRSLVKRSHSPRSARVHISTGSSMRVASDYVCYRNSDCGIVESPWI